MHHGSRWRAVLRGDPCVYCGATPADLAILRGADGLPRMTIEHIVPRSHAVGLRDNLATACSTCNVRRGTAPLLWYLVQVHAARTPIAPVRPRAATRAQRRIVRAWLQDHRAPALRVAIAELAH